MGYRSYWSPLAQTLLVAAGRVVMGVWARIEGRIPRSSRDRIDTTRWRGLKGVLCWVLLQLKAMIRRYVGVHEMRPRVGSSSGSEMCCSVAQ